MFNRKRIVLIVVFVLVMFFMMTFAGESVQNAAVATRRVIFTDGYNGKDIANFEVEVGNDVTAPAAPVHDNFIFAGWFDFNNRTKKIESFNTILNDTHVIGMYGEDLNKNGIIDSDEEKYLVTFLDTINGNSIKEESVLPGMSATAPEAPSVSGYSFRGWDRSYTNVQSDIIVSTVYTSIQNNETNPNTPNTPSTPSTPATRSYEVTFVDGENNKTISVVNVDEGLSATAPSAPKHEGRVFDYWDGTYTNVRSNQTVTAIYTDDKNNNGNKDYLDDHFTIKFAVSGHGKLEGKAEYNGILAGLTFKEANIVVPETIADEYYKFESWDSEFTKVTDNKTYTASFVPNNDVISENGGPDGTADETQEYKLIVNYVFTDGKYSMNSLTETRKYNDREYNVPAPEVTHYTAEVKNVSGVIGDDGKLTRTETIKYNRKEYTVTFKNDDGTVLDTQSVLAEEAATEIEEPTKRGTAEYSYVFAGWDKSFNKIVEDTIVTATYTETANEYKLTVNYVDKSGTKLTTSYEATIAYGFNYSINNPEITGYNTENEKLEGTMVAHDEEVNVLYNPNRNTPYIIKYYTKEIYSAANKYVFVKDETKNNGVTGEELTLTIDDLDVSDLVGFNLNTDVSELTKVIAADGTTEFIAKFDRNSYTITIDQNCDGDGCTNNPPTTHETGDELKLGPKTRTYRLTYSENPNVKPEDRQKSPVTRKATVIGYCDSVNYNDGVCSEVIEVNTIVKVNATKTYLMLWDESKLTVEVNDGAGYETEDNTYHFSNWDPEVVDHKVKLKGDLTLTAVYTHPEISVDITADIDENNKVEYNQIIKYTITMKNTGGEDGVIEVIDNELKEAIAAGYVSLVDEKGKALNTNEEALAIINEGIKNKKIVKNGEETIVLKVRVVANVDNVISSQITYSLDGKSNSSNKIEAKVEKTISFIEKSETVSGTNIVVVLDHSGSMDGNRMKKAKDATTKFINDIFKKENLSGTNVTVLTFGSTGTHAGLSTCKNVVYSSDIVGATAYNKHQADELVKKVREISEKIDSCSLTPYNEAFKKTYDVLYGENGIATKDEYKNNKNVVVFLSDGEMNPKDKNFPNDNYYVTEMNEYVDSLKGNGVTIYTIGYEIEKYQTIFGFTTDTFTSEYKMLYDISGSEDRTFVAKTTDISTIFDAINTDIASTPNTNQTDRGVADMGSELVVNGPHPIAVIVTDSKEESEAILETVNADLKEKAKTNKKEVLFYDKNGHVTKTIDKFNTTFVDLDVNSSADYSSKYFFKKDNKYDLNAKLFGASDHITVIFFKSVN